MNFIIYVGLYLLIIGSTIAFAALSAPLVDDDYNIIKPSKLQQWKKRLKNSIQQIGKEEAKNK